MINVGGQVQGVGSFTPKNSSVPTFFVDLEGHLQVNLPQGVPHPKFGEQVNYLVHVRHLEGQKLMFTALPQNFAAAK